MPASLFWAFTLLSIGVFAAFGRRVERGFTVVILAGLAATWAVYKPMGGADPRLVLAIDSLILVPGLALVLFTNRFWPIWFSGFHSLSVLTGVAHLLSPDHVPRLFFNLAGFWFYPAIWCSAAGVVMDWRSRGARTRGSDDAST